MPEGMNLLHNLGSVNILIYNVEFHQALFHMFRYKKGLMVKEIIEIDRMSIDLTKEENDSTDISETASKVDE